MDNKQQMCAYHQCCEENNGVLGGALSEEVMLKLRPEGQVEFTRQGEGKRACPSEEPHLVS